MKRAKQVIVVRKDLNMRKGKLAAQVAHASLKVILDQMMTNHYTYGDRHWMDKVLSLRPEEPLSQWLLDKFTKIVVYVESEDAIHALANKCHFLNVPCAVITDSGKTEFHGEPTVTCIAIGPDWEDKVDEITGDLPLM